MKNIKSFDSFVNEELFGMKRDMKTKKNLENIKEISDKQKENTPEGKADKYKKMRDDMITDLEKSLEEDETNEGKINPDKKLINSVFRKYGLKPLEYHPSYQVRGWGNFVGKGYKYEYGGYIYLKGIDRELINKMTDEMKALGVDIRNVGDTEISYRETRLD